MLGEKLYNTLCNKMDVKYNVQIQEIIWVTAAEEEAVLKAAEEVGSSPPWSPQRTCSPRTGICSQTWTVAPVGRPARSEASSTSQKCPGTRLTAPPPPHRARSCPSCRFWSASSSPGGAAGSVRGGCRPPEFAPRRRKGAGAGRGSWRIC